MMFLTVWVTCFLLALAAGCGRLSFDEMSDAQGGTAPFGPPMPLTQLNSVLGDDDPTFTSDLLEVMFDSERDNASGDFFEATRPTVDGAWSLPQQSTLSSATSDEDGPLFTRDDLTVTFASERMVAGDPDLYVATRATRTSPWMTPVRIAELASGGEDERLTITADGLNAVFTSDRAGGHGSNDLYATTRATTTSAWTPPVNIAELNTRFIDYDPCLDPSGLVLYFTSARNGNDDIFVATRATVTSPFDPPVVVEAITTTMSETDPWISADQRLIVFTRGGNTERELYFATR